MDGGLGGQPAGCGQSVEAVARELLALPPTLLHSVSGLMVLLVVQVLNVYKPQGLTSYGWRKQQEERKRHQPRTVGVR